MSNEAENITKLLHFTDSLCTFAENVVAYYTCKFEIEIGDDKFKFELPELVAEIRKYHQAVIDDIKNCSDGEQDGEVLADKHKLPFAEPFVPEFTTKTSSDEITMSDFDYFHRDIPYSAKLLFDMLLPLSIIREAEGHKKLSEPKPKSERIKIIEAHTIHTILKMIQIIVS